MIRLPERPEQSQSGTAAFRPLASHRLRASLCAYSLTLRVGVSTTALHNFFFSLDRVTAAARRLRGLRYPAEAPPAAPCSRRAASKITRGKEKTWPTGYRTHPTGRTKPSTRRKVQMSDRATPPRRLRCIRRVNPAGTIRHLHRLACAHNGFRPVGRLLGPKARQASAGEGRGPFGGRHLPAARAGPHHPPERRGTPRTLQRPRPGRSARTQPHPASAKDLRTRRSGNHRSRSSPP